MSSHHGFTASLEEQRSDLERMAYERAERKRQFGGYEPTPPEWYEITSVRERITYTQCAWLNYWRVASTVVVLMMKQARRESRGV